MKKPARHIISRGVGMSISAAVITAGVVALRHMLGTPQPLKSTLPGEPLLYVWRKRSIFYKVLGAADAPPLVLLHTPDIGASAREMQRIMEPLALTYRVYAPDLLGFGLSDRPDIEYSAAMYGELCQDFVREVVKRPATLVASGLSCNYAVSLAAHAPDLCAGLVLISPLVLHGDEEPPRLVRDFAEKPLSKALLYPLLSTRLAFLLTHVRASEQADFAQFHATTHQLGAQHAAMALVAGKLTQDSAREFEALQQPVLLIWGTQALEDQRNIASLHDTSQLRRVREVELIQGAGLAVHEEQPESVVAAIRRWQAEFSTVLLSPTDPSVPDLAAALQHTNAKMPDTVPVARARVETSQPIQMSTPIMPVEAFPNVPANGTPSAPEQPDTHGDAASPHLLILGYCVKCKAKTEMLHASEFTMKNGRLAVRGTCSICEGGITRIGGLR